MSRKNRDRVAAEGRPRKRSRAIMPGAPLMRLEPRLLPAVITPFAPRFSANANGDIVFVANTLMTPPGNSIGEVNARAGTGTAINNNDYSMVFVDVDADPTTFNSSRANLAMPPGGTVLFAGLYWGAQSSSTSRNKVLFQVPGSSGYTSVTGSVVGSLGSGDYSGFADVTAAVRGAGVGSYAVANVQAKQGTNEEAGWSLVVAYGDPIAPPRNLTVFDGFASVDSTTPNVSIGISGFKAPLTGTVKASVGFVAYEGDAGYTGDGVTFNGTTLSDARNPAGNFFNSTISNRGTLVATKSPDYVNQFGLDADIVSTTGLVANGATSAAIALTTGGETYYPAVVTTAIDLYAPIVSSTKGVVDLNGGTVRPGDILEYTDTVQVTSGEAATKFVLADAIPANTTYVAGSLSISGVARTDGSEDDQAEYEVANGRVVFRLGTGATSTTGGTIAVAGSATVKFRVQVAATAPDRTVIAGQSTATFTGQTTGANLSASCGLASLTVERPADLSVVLSASNLTPNVGDLVTFTITVSNVDDTVVNGVVVKDILPTGLTYQSSMSSTGTFDPTTGSWAIGTLDGNATLTIVARVVATSAVTNTAAITASDQPDLVAANNTGSVTITPLRADLALTKNVSAANPNLGQRITFVTTLTDLGPNASTNVTISDRLPAGFTLVSAVVSGGVYDSGTGLWSLSVIGGTPATLTITADVATLAASVATASIVSADVYDPASSNNTASVAVTPQKVDLAVTKTVDVARPNLGDVIVLTTRVSNAGPSAATGITILSAAGPGLTFLSALVGQGTFDAATGLWNAGTVASSGQAVLRVTARVDSANAITSTASATLVDQSDTAPNNNGASVGITPQKADLAPTQSVSNSAPNVGDVVTFTITIGDAGPDAASGVKVQDILPAGFQYQSSTATRGSYDPNTGLWTVGAVASGMPQVLRITARVVGATPATNTASIFASDQYDPNTANNSATASSTPQQVDLSLSSAFAQSRPNVGDVIQYTVTVTAPGPGSATGVTVSVPLPPGLSYISSTAGAGSYNSEGSTWSVGTVAPGTPITLTITARLTGTGTTSATASISGSAQFDPGTANNTATASVTPQRSDLALAATIDDATPNVGDTVTFTITLSNTGDDAATGVSIANSLPAGLSLVSVSGPGAYDAGKGLWSVGSLAAGQQATLVITATIVAPVSATATATVSAVDQFDPVPSNNSSSVTFATRQSGLSLAATVDAATPNVGDLVTFVVTLNNVGPDTATGIAIRNLLPAGLNLKAATPSQGSFANGTGVWSVGSLSGEGSATLTIQAVVIGGPASTMTASVLAADQYDPNGADNIASATVTPLQADLSLSVDASPVRPQVGQGVTFILTLGNNGPNDATNVRIIAPIPAGMSFGGEDVGGGFYEPSTGIWSIPTVASGEAFTLFLTLNVLAPTVPDFVATVEPSDLFDPTTGDRSVSIAISPLRVDLGITATVDTPNPNHGDIVTFTVTLADLGTDSTDEVVASALLPAGYTYVDSTATAGGYDSESGTWSVGLVDPGTPRVLSIRAVVGVVTPSALVATITASDQYDPAPANNSASAFVRPKQADLSVGSVVSNPTPNVGNTITYTISVVNAGPDTATGVILHDTIPSGIAFVSAAPGQGSYNALTGVWTVGSLAPGAEAILSLVAIVTDASSTTNQASVQAVDQFDMVAANDSAQTSVVPQQSELRLTNLVSDPSPLVGDVVTFTVSLKNLGINPATGVVVAVPLPAGLAYASDDASGAYDSSTGTWTVGTVAANGTIVLTLRATVTAPDLATTTATIQGADQFDPNANDNSAGAQTRPEQSDLSLSFATDSDRPDVGDVITLTVTVRNQGGDDATEVRIDVPLPAGLTYVSDSPDLGSYDPATGLWTLGTLAAGSSTGLVLHLWLVSGDPIPVAAGVSHLDQSDPVPDDDAITATLTPRNSDLALVVSVDDATPDLGGLVEFTLTLSNAGPDAATGVRVLDALPAGLTFDSSAATGGSFDATTGIWDVGPLASGASVTLTLRARVATTASVTNAASIVAADQFDPDVTEDGGSATVTPRQANLAAGASVDVARPNVGDVITLTVTVTNAGPDDAHGVILLNALPPGLVVVDFTPDQGTFSSATGVWSVGTVAAGTTRTLQIRARVEAAAIHTDSIAISSADEADPSSANNAASITVTPQVSDLAVTATVDNSRPNVGGLITITITLTNVGPDAAGGVRIASVLPAGLEYVSSTADAGTYDPIAGTWTVGASGPGTPLHLRIVARVTSAVPTTPSASITHADQFDPTTGDETTSTTITPQQSDLALTTTVDRVHPNVGDRVTITVTLTDVGDPATGVGVISLLPAGLTFVSDDAGGSYNRSTGLWTVGTVTPGSPRVLRIVAVVASSAAVTPTASIASADQFDPTPGNDSANVTITPQQSDLVVTIAVDNPTPNAGDLVTITVTVTDTGDPATGVSLTSLLPAGLSFVSSDAAEGYNSATGLWSAGTVAPGTPRILHLVARVATAGPFAASASISHTDQYDPDPGDNATSITISPRRSDLRLAASVDAPRPNVGDLVTITFTLTNAGPDAATGVRATNLLPAGLTYVSSSFDGDSYDPATGLWTVGAVGPGATDTLRIVARISSASPTSPSASVSHRDQFDSTAGNDTATVTITPKAADLSVTEAVDHAHPNVGDLVTITVTVTDAGDPATGVRISSLLPAGLSFVSDDSSGTYDPATGLWSVGTVAPGTPRVLHLVARVAAAGPFAPSASVSHSDQADPTPGNDSSTVSITTQAADLSLTEAVDDPSPAAGEVVTFTLTLTNAGPDAATAVSIMNSLADGFEFVSATPGSGTFDSASGIWSIASVLTGTPLTLQVRARVVGAGATVSTARVLSSDQHDPNSDGPTSVTVVPRAVDLFVVAEGLPSSALVGQRLDFRIIATNRGPDAATGVTLPVAIPAGFRLVSATPGQGNYDLASGLWSVGVIPAGRSIELRFAIEVTASGDQEVVAGPIRSDEFDASAADDIARSGVDAATSTAAPVAPTVTYPSSIVTITASSATITGTAQAGSLVRIYSDPNGNGVIDEGEVVVGSLPLAPGQASFAITVPLTPDAANHFLATATDGLGSQSSPAVVPKIDQVSTATIAGGIVFLDYNADGLLDAGEPGLAGRVVYADLNRDGVFDAGDATTITDATGHFAFPALAAGSVGIAEVAGQNTYSRHVVDQLHTNPDGSLAIGVVPISPVAPVPVVPSPFAATPSADAYTSYVRSLYRAVLGRDGADSEVATWVARLQAGMTRHEVALGFVGSPEHRQDQVRSYYREFLHREPEPGSAIWVDALLSGASEERVVAAILDSPEYQAAHADPAQFVRDLYLDVLGRQGEATGMAGWVARLDSGLGREAVVAAFVNSPEAIDQMVTSFYAAYLHRRREPGTSDLWADMLGTPGGSATDVAAGILASPEFVLDAVASAPPGFTGTVYLDDNADGLPEAGEPGLAGRVVFADVNRDGVLDAGDITAITDAGGHFTLSGLAAGSAEVFEATGQDATSRHVVDQFHTNPDGSLAIGVVPISPVAPVPVVPNPFSTSPSTDPNTAYVQSLYKAVLGRAGADAEVDTWLVKLTDGMTRREVAAGFVNSPEHRQDQVRSYYREFLHREPEPGSAIWVDALLSGASEERVVAAILDSPEYQAAHADPAQFVRDLYLDVLGRQGEATGMAGWVARLDSGLGREAVMAHFVDSAEAIDQLVQSDYVAFLHRRREGGTTSDIWVRILEAPDGSATDVAAGILASPEFLEDATTPQG